MSRLIGYARVSTDDQKTHAQLDALRAIGCDPIFQEFASGADSSRPELARAIASARAGDTLVVTRLDRLARSVRHLLQVIDDLESVGAAFRSLGDPVDTSTPQGVFNIQILAAVAELERALIAERTRAGIAAAKARGSRPGNPGLRARDPKAIAKLTAGMHATHLKRILATADRWLPAVRRMRPATPWAGVVKSLNADPATREGGWTVERLKRTVRLLVNEHIAERSLLERAPRRRPRPELFQIILAIRIANPGVTLRQIARQLQEQKIKSPRGHARWTPSMVASAERPPSLG